MGLLGGIGQTLLFLCALALLGIVGSLIYSYAARCFLSIVQDSSAGNEKIEWGNEPFIDWLFRGGYLLYLTLVWLAPVGIILRSIDRDFFLSQSPLAAFIAGIVLWLFFPLGALSSMSATSQWVIFRWSVVRRFFGQGAVAGQFYMLSLALLVLGLGPWMLVLATGNILLFFFAGICSMAAFLMYARLLGRMAWILSGRPKIQRRKPRERKDIKAPVPKQEEKVEEIEEIEELEEVEEIEEVNIPPRPLTQERFTLPEEEEVEELPQFALVEEEKKTVAEEEDGDELKLKPLDDGEEELEFQPLEPDEYENTQPYFLGEETESKPVMDDTPIDGYLPVEEETPAQETTRERRPKRRRRIKRIRPERAPASLIHGVFSVVGQEKVLTVWLLLSLGASGVGLICRWMISLVPS